MTAHVPHRMKLSIRKRSSLKPVERAKVPAGGQDCLVVWCTCMAQVEDQDRKPEAVVEWRFWAFDYIAIIPVSQPAGRVFRQHVAERDAHQRSTAA